MQRLFTYNIQTKVGSNLNRYTYVLNNPLKYTDPSGYAYYGYGGANTSAGVMQNRCLISQQIEDFETRRSAFLSNQWHDVTLFDMIGDRGGAVSGNYSTPATLLDNAFTTSDNDDPKAAKNKENVETQNSTNQYRLLDALPLLGSAKLYLEEANKGNYQAAGYHLAFFTFELFTFGAASEYIIANRATNIAAKSSTKLLSAEELLRIENAATRIGKPITVVGSRATLGRVSNGVNTKTGNIADWDYVIPSLNRKNWNKIKNSLPGTRSVIDNSPRNIEIIKGPVWPDHPHITIYPR